MTYETTPTPPQNAPEKLPKSPAPQITRRDFIKKVAQVAACFALTGCIPARQVQNESTSEIDPTRSSNDLIDSEIDTSDTIAPNTSPEVQNFYINKIESVSPLSPPAFRFALYLNLDVNSVFSDLDFIDLENNSHPELTEEEISNININLSEELKTSYPQAALLLQSYCKNIFPGMGRFLEKADVKITISPTPPSRYLDTENTIYLFTNLLERNPLEVLIALYHEAGHALVDPARTIEDFENSGILEERASALTRYAQKYLEVTQDILLFMHDSFVDSFNNFVEDDSADLANLGLILNIKGGQPIYSFIDEYSVLGTRDLIDALSMYGSESEKAILNTIRAMVSAYAKQEGIELTKEKYNLYVFNLFSVYAIGEAVRHDNFTENTVVPISYFAKNIGAVVSRELLHFLIGPIFGDGTQNRDPDTILVQKAWELERSRFSIYLAGVGGELTQDELIEKLLELVNPTDS